MCIVIYWIFISSLLNRNSTQFVCKKSDKRKQANVNRFLVSNLYANFIISFFVRVLWSGFSSNVIHTNFYCYHNFNQYSNEKENKIYNLNFVNGNNNLHFGRLHLFHPQFGRVESGLWMDLMEFTVVIVLY